MRLDEFQNGVVGDQIKVSAFIAGLRARHTLAQMGGKKRVYQIGRTGQLGVIFMLSNSDEAIGVAWRRGQKFVSTLYVWKDFNISDQPDIAIEIPEGAELPKLLDQIEHVLTNPRVGVFEADEEHVEAVPTPGSKTIKIGPAPDMAADALDDLTKRLIKRGDVALVARNTNGEFFFVPDMEQKLRRLDAMLDRQIASKGDGESMEEQYAGLEEEVLLVAGRKSRHVKALIVTGAPSAGKSFRVMKVIKELGLRQGRDYIMKTGAVTDASLYRLLIEQLDGLIIFDDCDSVWETTKAANFLKGALNTGAVRTINNDSQRTINIATLTEEDRRDWLEAASRILRNRPHAGDIELVNPKLRATMKDFSADAYANYLVETQKYIQMNPPNQIDFTGRVIFISNLEEDQLDPAVISRSNCVNLSFSDEEMLDFIETIGDKLEDGDLQDGGEPLTATQIAEVFEFVRHQIAIGVGFTVPINFRFIQKCFDYRRSNAANWKKRIAKL